MNVLFVTEKFPYPLDNGGNVRTFHLLKGLAREHQVTLVAADPGDVRKSDVEAVNGLCRDVRLVRVPRLTTARDVLHLLGSFASGVPFLLSRHVYAAVRAEIETLFGQGAQAFDVVHFNHLDSALYRDVVPPGVMQVLDQHNIVTNQVKTSLGAETSPARRVILRKELRKLLRFEPELCQQMDACLVCSEADAQALQNLGVKQTPAVIPNGVDLEYFEMAPLPRERRNTIAFLGTLDYDPCEKAVWYCCTEILPLIRREVPDLRFVVVGRNPSPRLEAIAAADPAVVLTGRVEDVRPHVQSAAVFVVPLLSGSGTRLKILEAMAMGVPVVSTTIGIEGIDAVHGRHAYIADAPADFAAGVVRLLRDVEAAEAMRLEARSLVEARYGWPAVCQRLLDQYASLAARRRGA